MVEKKLLSEVFMDLLAKVDFDRRYYGYIAAHRSPATGRGHPPVEEVEAVLKSTSLGFKYNKREKFFGHLEQHGRLQLGLNVAVSSTQVEFILVAKTEQGHLGQPFTLLARQVAKRRDPGFEPSPRAPQVPFASPEGMREAILFGIELFKDVRREILTHEGLAAGETA